MTASPFATSLKEQVARGSEEAVRRLLAADPILVDVAPRREVVAGREDRMILRFGPPIEWSLPLL